MSDKKSVLLQDLLEIATDSKNFYSAAAEAVELPFLKQMFAHMADAKDSLAIQLSAHIEARGNVPDDGGSLAGNLRRIYTDVLAALSSASVATYTYTAELEETEDRLLEHFDRALAETDSMDVRAVLLTELPKLRRSHERMKQLKDSLTA
jgi:uncharacterized protein (TIGR02284 family)